MGDELFEAMLLVKEAARDKRQYSGTEAALMGAGIAGGGYGAYRGGKYLHRKALKGLRNYLEGTEYAAAKKAGIWENLRRAIALMRARQYGVSSARHMVRAQQAEAAQKGMKDILKALQHGIKP